MSRIDKVLANLRCWLGLHSEGPEYVGLVTMSINGGAPFFSIYADCQSCGRCHIKGRQYIGGDYVPHKKQMWVEKLPVEAGYDR